MVLSAGWLLVSCGSPRRAALRELDARGVLASGSALLDAVDRRDLPLAALLLEAGVHTEQRDSRGFTPLAIAVERRDLPLACMLLNAGANPNAKAGELSFIPAVAAQQPDDLMFGLLLAAGAHTSGLMPDGDPMLPWAIRHGRGDLVALLMRGAGADPHAKDRRGNPLLHIAMEVGRRDLMDVLINLGADAAAVNAAGETTLHLALRQGWHDVLPKLVAAGADPNAPGPKCRTLLEAAIEERDVRMIALLLRLGADPHFRHGAEGAQSPWERAMADSDPWCFELLLAHGTRPPGGAWDSCLWLAYQRADHDKARLLLKHGAGGVSRGPQGLLPVEAATAAGDAGFLKLFLDYACPPGRALEHALARGDHRLASLLLAGGVSPDGTRIPGRETPLSAALRRGHDHLAAMLIDAGADISLLTPEGQSPLHLAVATSCHRSVKQLLARGGDPNAPFAQPVSTAFVRLLRPGAMRWVLKYDRGATLLMLAADTSCVPAARHLLRAGAKANVRTRMSALWPINFASRRGDVPMMRLFLGRDPGHEERVIEIRLSEQCARLYDAAGNELFHTKVSTGRAGFATPTGEFAITNKHRHWKSTLYHASMPYFQRLSCGDFGLHQGNVPGYPASHGCIRVPAGNAARLFELTQTGDRVRILP